MHTEPNYPETIRRRGMRRALNRRPTRADRIRAALARAAFRAARALAPVPTPAVSLDIWNG